MNSSKRVVHLTTVHHPYDPRIYHKECRSLQQAGFEVTLIAKKEENDTKKETPVKHLTIKSYKNRLKRMLLGSFDAYKKARALEADVYHFHDPELMPVGWLLKKKNNTVIYDIHEDYVTSILQKDYMKAPVRKLIATTYKYMEKFFTRDMELCLAEKYYKDIYPNGTCILNYPTINKKFSEYNRLDAPLEDALLYTGNVTVDRGALIHAQIPKLEPSISVHFIGKCPKKLADKMYEMAGSNKENLDIEGIDQFIEKEDIEAKYLSKNWLAGIAIFPPTEHYMKKELTKFFEYMNAGLPIICSNFPVWKEFVEKHQCGIAVDPYNEQEIKEAIHFLKTNQQEAKEMGKRGKRAVLNELNWGKEEQKLIEWYHRLINDSNSLQKGMTE